MNEILDIEIILKKQKYHFIYNLGIILVFILLVFIYISFTYKYKSYYITKGIFKNDYLEILVNVNDIKYISNNYIINVDNNWYEYKIEEISEDNIIDESYNNYKYVYLKVNNLSNINNYVYEVKLEKENKKIIEYVKDYL